MFKKQKQDTTAQTPKATAPAKTLPNIVVESFTPYRRSCPELSGHGVMLVPRQPQDEKDPGLYDIQLTNDDGRKVIIEYGLHVDPKDTTRWKRWERWGLGAFIGTIESHIAKHSLSLEDIPSFIFEYADIEYKYDTDTKNGSFKKSILSRYKYEMLDQFAKTKTNEEREQLIAQVRGELAKFNAEFDEKSAGVQRQTKKLLDEFDALFTEGDNDEQE